MAETPTIQIDVSVMLEKLEAELRRVEAMVGATAGRIESRLRGGGGGGAVGAAGGGAVGAVSAVSGGRAAGGGGTFVASSAGTRAGVMTATAGGGAATVGGAGAGVAGGAIASRFGSAALRRIAGPAAILTAAYATTRSLDDAITGQLEGTSTRGFGRDFFGGIESFISAIPGARTIASWSSGYRNEISARAQIERDLAKSSALSPMSDSIIAEIGARDFDRRIGRMAEAGDIKGIEEATIARTVQELSLSGTMLRAMGIAPELLDRRNQSIAESIASELVGNNGGKVDSVSTAAGVFSIGQRGGGGSTAEAILERILKELQQMNTANITQFSGISAGTVG